jgi:hypothetical protein
MTYHDPTGPTAADDAPPSLGVLFSRLTEQTSKLVRAEIALAKNEMTAKLSKLGMAIGLFAAAGILALYGLGVLIDAAVLGLAEALPAWLAALIVAVVLFLVVGILALIGKKRLDAGTPPKPEAAAASVKKDVDAVKKGLKS